ncbi:hypothetical protein ACTXT7_011472 [Hymenolepis weldensis]
MADYVKGFAQFSSSAGWIFINDNLQLIRIEQFFVHPALGSSLVFQAEVILFEITCRKPPSAGPFIHDIICKVSLSVFAAAVAAAAELGVFP